MKILFLLCALSYSLTAIGGNQCGSKEGYLNELASTFLIPDQFPPEVPILHTGEFRRCGEDYAPVNLGVSCVVHDRCYETPGATKQECDRRLQDDWVKSCKYRYPDRGDFITRAKRAYCRVGCQNFVKLMSEAQRYDANGFCPSCDAFEEARRDLP